MRRRDLIGVLAAAVIPPGQAWAQPWALARSFGEVIRRKAKALAAKPYVAPVNPLPTALAQLNYDGYRDLRFRAEKAIWRDLGLPFQLQMFARSGMHADTVELFEVVRGAAWPIAYRPEMFTSGPLAPDLAPDLGFGGFRIHAPINDPTRFDEFAVFQGASYFRAIPRDGVYGLSARGLEVGSGDPVEEFPAFRSFYIERPAPGAASLTVHALLDGPSVAGAYRFVITPGDPTVFDVSLTLFPRRSLENAGIAPLTSMFLFGPEQPRRFDDFRPEVHDSDGLLTDTGEGERRWRPLANPDRPQIVQLAGPGGFGLLQRRRTLGDYQDLEANYHRRPGAWVAPVADWGAGGVRLVELPARDETDDNIVASWRPSSPLNPGQEYRFAYRLGWSSDPSPITALAQIGLWRTGAGSAPNRRRFVVEFGPFTAEALGNVSAEVTTTSGEILHRTLQLDAATTAARVSFELDPQSGATADLRARLVGPAGPASETWCGRWDG